MGEHRIPREFKAHAEVAAEWSPASAGMSCATCFWNWKEEAPGMLSRQDTCHLMPRQLVIVGGNQLAAALPAISSPETSLCSGFKPREIPNGETTIG
jgi:hypothetical protein